ncbi:MAG: hypothetical protein ACSLFM_10095 [Tepidiformaceae bacterium]
MDRRRYPILGRLGQALEYIATVPERVVRAAAAGLGGATHETGRLVLPRFVRRSRFYEVTAKNALRIAIELVGGVEPAEGDREPAAPAANRLAVKKAAGNAFEIGSIAAFGFSPLWLLAAASDVLNGSRTYLVALQDELVAAGYLAPDVRFDSVDQLLGALQGATGTTAGAIDTPPIEMAELRKSISELRSDVASLPKSAEIAALFNGLVRTARAENRPLLEVSTGVGLAFLTSARQVSNQHVVVPYRDDWAPLRAEGFGAYASRISGPYLRAVNGHLDREKTTWTKRGIDWVRIKTRRRLQQPEHRR